MNRKKRIFIILILIKISKPIKNKILKTILHRFLKKHLIIDLSSITSTKHYIIYIKKTIVRIKKDEIIILKYYKNIISKKSLLLNY